MALAANGAPLQEDKLAVPASQASLWGPMDTRVKVGGAAASHWTTECPGHPWSCFPPAGFAQGNKAPHTNKQWPLLWLHRKHIEPCRHYTAVELSVQRMGHILIGRGHSWRRNMQVLWYSTMHGLIGPPAHCCCRPMAAALVSQSQLPGCSSRYNKNTTHLPTLQFSFEVDVITVQQWHLWQVKVFQYCRLLWFHQLDKNNKHSYCYY